MNCVLAHTPPDAYLCPLCLMVYEEKGRTFGSPHTVGPLPGSAAIAGIPSHGLIGFDGETFDILDEPDQNNPALFAAHVEAMGRMGDGSSIRLTWHTKRNDRRAGIGWMRAAYLAAFAVYGYRYVLRSAFEPLRAAIAAPDDTSFDPIIVQGPDVGEIDPLIAEATEPAWLAECPIVFFGPRVIVLPPQGAPEDWLANVKERLVNTFPFDATFASVIDQGFPDHPLYRSDV